METVLGRGYSINDDFCITDFYSPPSSIADQDEEQDDDLFYPEEEHNEVEVTTDNIILSSSSINENNDTNLKHWLKPLPLKLMSIETTPPPTPLMQRRLVDPVSQTTTAFQSMTINTNLPITPPKSTDTTVPSWPLSTSSLNPLFPYSKTTTPQTKTNLLTPTNVDRYLTEHRHLSDSVYKSSRTVGTATTNTLQSISVQHTEVNNETSRFYSYMDHVDGLSSNLRAVCATSSNSWSTFDDTASMPSQISINKSSYVAPINMKPPPCLNNSLLPQRINSVFPNSNGSFSQTSTFQHQQYQSNDPWFLSEMSTIVRQNQQNTNILLSATAQQILAANTTNNNRPLRSEKIDIEVIKHLIREANWKRQCGMKKEVCVFCRNNGENELIYSSHSLKDSMGNVTCPILRAYQCPICGATGAQAHTIKYCQATGDDNNRHLPTPYEKMLRMQTMGFDDNIAPTIPGLLHPIVSPSSLYTNGWSDSYL